MRFQLAKIDKYKVPILLFLNTYFFWFVIQTIRGFALTTDFESAFSLIGLALILMVIELFVQSFLKNSVMAKIGFAFFTIILIIINLTILSLTDFENYYLLILIGYGIFFPGFYDYISKATKDSDNKGAILIVFSFICSFIANLIERYFLLTFNPILNPILIYVITPLLCILFIISINKIEREPHEKQEPSSIKYMLKMRLRSIVCTTIIACVFIIQMVFYNNPSLLGISTLFDYDLSVFLIILSYAVFFIILLLFSFNFEAKDKRFRLMILIFSTTMLITFLLAILFQSPIQMVLFLVSNVFLLLLLVIVFACQESYQIQSSFLTCLLLTLILYLLSSGFGLFLMVLPLICVILFGFSILLLVFAPKQELSISYNSKNSSENKKI